MESKYSRGSLLGLETLILVVFVNLHTLLEFMTHFIYNIYRDVHISKHLAKMAINWHKIGQMTEDNNFSEENNNFIRISYTQVPNQNKYLNQIKQILRY